MDTMKAIVKNNAAPGVELITVAKPKPKENEVLVKIKKTAICGTDAHIYKWDDWAKKVIKPPMIIGHEFVGEVVEIGSSVNSVKVGSLVSAEGHIVCNSCRHCITGKRHLCRQTKGVGVNIDGVFAEYAAIKAENIWLCNPNISEEILAIQDPLGNAIHTALSFDVLGEDVLITGAGPIGLMAIPVLKMAGARNIVITDVNPKRLAMAKSMGADKTVDVRSEKISNAMQQLNIIEGFDIGLEMSGNPSALSDMVNSMANGGKIAILGIFSSDITIDWNKVIFHSLTLKGIYGREIYDTWYKMSALLQSGLAEKIEKVITHIFDYPDYEHAFKLMLSGESSKIILNWE